MKKINLKFTGQDSLTKQLQMDKQEVTLLNYLSLAGIDLPLDKENAAYLAGKFPQWEEEIEKLTE